MPSKRINYISLKVVKESTIQYPNRRINSAEDAVELLRQFMEGSDREIMLAIYLNTKNEPTAIQTIGIGTLNSCPVHSREIFKGAIATNANSIIIAHSHPSGDPTPSHEDIKITETIVEVGRIIGIEVLDHIILGDGKFVSLKAQGKM